MEEVKLIGIAGCSASGKTTYASWLKEFLGEGKTAIITVDSYYNNQDTLTIEERRKTNYDHPDSLEFKLLLEHLHQIKNSQAVQIPIYDYTVHNRSSDTLTFEPVDCVIVEGILALYLKEVRELFSSSIFVEAPLDLMYQRRLDRDVKERGRTEDTVNWQWNETVVPMYEKYCLPTKEFADYVVDGSCFTKDDVSKLAVKL